MKTIFILAPLYNDWKSLSELLNKIKIKVKQKIKIKFLVVNDCSHDRPSINFKKKKFISTIKILNLKKNMGHDRAIVLGLYYLIKKKISFHSVITMDADGEDNPKYLSQIINASLKNPNHVVISKRSKRSEGLNFKIFYYIHLFLMFVFTYRWLNHGGYNLLPKKLIVDLLKSKTIWGSYSASLEKLKVNKKIISTKRGKRYFGPSQTSFQRLFFHSLTIMTAFKEKIIISAFAYLLFVYFFSNKELILSSILIFIFSVIFFLFYSLSFREKKDWKKIFFKNISY